MQLKLDIMRDEWLPVVMSDGVLKNVSLYTAISEAQSIRRLQKIGNVNIQEYSIYAFLFDFVQWLYKPTGYDKDEKQEAIEELFENGKFDVSILDSYIKKYEESGRSFDLFDEEFPFMQTQKKEWEKYKDSASLKSFASPMFGVGYLSGNNTLFEHGTEYPSYETFSTLENVNNVVPGKEIGYNTETKIEDIVNLKPVDVFANILYSIAYKHSSGKGSYASVSASCKAHPIFVLIEGKNLFETICASIGTSKSYSAKPIWERETYALTSNDLMKRECDNSIALTYTPTAHIFPCDYEKINTCVLSKKNYFGKEVDNSPKNAYSKWLENYPRVMRRTVKDKEGEHSEAVIYTYENISSKSPVLQTNLLQLGANTESCDVVSINYEALKRKTELTIHFYALAYKSSTNMALNLLNYATTLTWNKELNRTALRRLPKLLDFTANVARETAKAIDQCDKNARTRRTGNGGKLSNNAILETDYAINEVLHELENHERVRLTSENLEEYNELYDMVVEKFANCFEEHKHYLPKHSLLEYVEAKEKYDKMVRNLKETVLEKKKRKAYGKRKA